jgi:hypothetical protein
MEMIMCIYNAGNIREIERVRKSKLQLDAEEASGSVTIPRSQDCTDYHPEKDISGMYEDRCRKHKDYEAIYKPKNDCFGCWRAWSERKKQVAKLESYWGSIKHGWWDHE